MILRIGVLLLLSAAVLPASGHRACLVDGKTAVSLQNSSGTITVPVEVNGITARFILDTGAQRSLVTEAAVARLSLARDPWVGTTMQGIGGIDRRANANPRSLSLGGVPLIRRTLNHDASLTVGLLPNVRAGNQIVDGALGRDFLAPFDLDLDLPENRLTLYQVHDCNGSFIPWPGAYRAIAVSDLAGHALVVPVVLDGTKLHAMLDTGASASLVSATGMFRLGLQPPALEADPADQVGGIGTRPVTMHRHTFHAMQIGAEVIDQPVLWVAPVRPVPTVDMLLGADWLSARRVWISYATAQLFVMTP